MAHWSYRIVKESRETAIGIESYYKIKEVYYDDHDTPHSSGQADLYSEEVVDIQWMLTRMQEACKKPILEYNNNLKIYVEVDE